MNTSIVQLQLMDAETDAKRLAKSDLKRAIDCDLRLMRDYMHPKQFIVWEPGLAGYCEITSSDSCTCQRFHLLGRCAHMAFVHHLEALNALPERSDPIAARQWLDDE